MDRSKHGAHAVISKAPNIYTAFAPGWTAPRTRELQRYAAESAAGRGDQEPLLDLSLAGHLLLPLVIFVCSLASIAALHQSSFIASLWASNAIMLVALLRHVRSPANYVSILLGGACAIALAGVVWEDGLGTIAIIVPADIGEVTLAFLLLTLFRIQASNLGSFRNLLIFIAIVGGVAPLAPSVFCALALGPPHGIPWPTVWRNLYASHALSMTIVAPFLISITSQEWSTRRINERLPEVAASFVLFVAVGMCAAYFRPVIFVMAPAILLVTVRFGLIGATTATLVTALIALSFVIFGVGRPYLPQSELSDRILNLQAFLAITAFWALPTAALLAQRDRLLADLSDANARLTVESEKKSNLVLGLRRHLALAEENERLRLSRDLHDQAGQGLIAAILELNQIDPLVPGPARDRLHLVRKNMEELGKTLHRIAWELRPASIDELGLRRALSSQIAQWSEQCGIEVDFHGDEPALDEVPSDVGTAIYRVLQEGLTNIVKHAQRPSNVSVVISRSDVALQVIVEDNGCGFDVAAMAARPPFHRGLGLDGLRERLSLIGGTLDVESTVGAGTTLFARIGLEGQRSAA
jgi:signal transduction histidine kinase